MNLFVPGSEFSLKNCSILSYFSLINIPNRSIISLVQTTFFFKSDKFWFEVNLNISFKFISCSLFLHLSINSLISLKPICKFLLKDKYIITLSNFDLSINNSDIFKLFLIKHSKSFKLINPSQSLSITRNISLSLKVLLSTINCFIFSIISFSILLLFCTTI